MALLASGKWALVTGAGRGVGKAIALALAKEGASLALCARTKSQLEAVAAECKAAGAPAVETYEVDLSHSTQVETLAQTLLSQHGGVDILVNNAGIGAMGTGTDGNPDEWETMMAINLNAPMRLTRRLAPAMAERGGGTIINMGSVAAIEPMTSSCAYAASKHGLRGWSLSCYQNLRLKNIKVVLINPAFVNTDMVSGNPNTIPERMLQPSDVAEAAMLALKTTSACVPQEITLRLTLSAYA
eukprot:comp21151_c0_seq1/m.28630 comp21151_c0_seq1/g.28630  ORF comp21151_c0_seq1/g.28630 comp21151_c0_seq1/m.28630 type:complete len:242 (-) comp21151_c0_seq1:510-1235(-)